MLNLYTGAIAQARAHMWHIMEIERHFHSLRAIGATEEYLLTFDEAVTRIAKVVPFPYISVLRFMHLQILNHFTATGEFKDLSVNKFNKYF